MSANPEHLAAILAEFRKFALRAAEEDKMISPENVLLLADKVEAAVKRERREYERLHECFWKEETIQNFVRQLLNHSDDIRDAKPELAEAIRHFAQELIKAATPSPGNAAALREALERALKWWTEKGNILEREAAFKQIRAAIAAPARNCDRFATAEEAVAAFADHLRAWENAHGIRSEYPDHPVQVPAGAFAWLFAPAEGGKE